MKIRVFQRDYDVIKENLESEDFFSLKTNHINDIDFEVEFENREKAKVFNDKLNEQFLSKGFDGYNNLNEFGIACTNVLGKLEVLAEGS